MIFDHFDFIRKYRILGNGISEAIDFLLANYKKDLPAGRYEVSENVYVLVNVYETMPMSAGSFEAHKKYIDIQLMEEGEEQVSWSPIDQLCPKAERPENDFYEYAGDGTVIPLREGFFMIFYPNDGHMPGRQIGESMPARKLVAKVAVKSCLPL